jgi:uncharacterized protein YdcH (DUF465 family)
MRFTRLNPIKVQFNIIKRLFCHHNNLSKQIPENINIVSRFNDIDAKMNEIDTKIKNMDAIIFSIFCLWNGVYFPVILYFSN